MYHSYGINNPVTKPLKVHWHWGGGGMYKLSFTNPKMKSPWVSDRVSWVANGCSHHDLAIFPGMSGSGTASHPCDSEAEPHLIVKSHCVHPTVEQGSDPAYRGTRDP
jgi:hypothetical protein